MNTQIVTVQQILTRATGYLKAVCSHSLQPYRGCTFGKSLCGTGCYVQHHPWVLRGRVWGDFLEVRHSASESYRKQYHREQNWGRQQTGRFSLFCSSSTDPFLPQERKYRITHSLLQMMRQFPPDELILQTHSPLIVHERELLIELRQLCNLRIHISIEGDRDHLPGLPPPAATVSARIGACQQLTEANLPVVVTVAPLHPLSEPEKFFQKLGQVASAVVIDHFIEGDGSRFGQRTKRTRLYQAMQAVEPAAVELTYRDEMVVLARTLLPGRVGVGQAGFAGEYY